jgi:hypothetical protein
MCAQAADGSNRHASGMRAHIVVWNDAFARLMQPLETGAGAKEGQHSEVVFAVAAAEVLHMIIMHMQAVTWCVQLPVCP